MFLVQGITLDGHSTTKRQRAAGVLTVWRKLVC